MLDAIPTGEQNKIAADTIQYGSNEMSDTIPTGGQNKIAADTIEQLDLANQALETAKLHIEESQNVIQDTKDALTKQLSEAAATEA